MKVKFISKIFALFFCSLIFASAIYAQEKPQALKVSEYDTADDQYSMLEAAIEMFIVQLENEPETTIGFIGIYETDELGKKIKSILAKHPALKNEIRFLFYQCYPKDLTVAEFWLVPKDANVPRPAACGECSCPVLYVSGDETIDAAAGNLTFTANVKGAMQKVTKYTWYVSAGKIVEGQGTKTIRVDAQGATEITAIVRIGGTCDDEICPLEASEATKITGKSRK